MNKTIIQIAEKAYDLMRGIMTGNYSTEALVKLLVEYQISSLSGETLQEYLAAIKDTALYQINADKFDKPVIDIVGTGGDGKHTANISTLASLICAASDLVSVAKYGNGSASGLCGSMDILDALDISITLSKNEVEQSLNNKGFAPLYARSIYPGGKYVADARKIIGKPTIFNLLFPLARPVVGKQRFIFGCATTDQMKIVEKIFAKDSKVRCMIVHGFDGTDEISISNTGKTQYTLIDSGVIKHGILDCYEIFGIKPVNLASLQIASKEEAIEVFKSAINPEIKSEKLSAIRNAGIINAVVVLFVGIDNNDMNITHVRKYLEIASDALLSGKVQQLVNKLSSKYI